MSLGRVIHSLADLITGTAEASHQPLYHTTGGWKSVAGRVFDVRAYDGDVQAAIVAAGTAGGGTVLLDRGTTTLTPPTAPTGGVNAALWVEYDNITMQGHGDASELLVTSAASPTPAIFWPGKDLTNWASFAPTVYTMTAAAKGDGSVTLATAGQAGNFAADDWVRIRTGQVTEASGQNQPDSEINQILAANAGTGVLTMRWPLAKAYAQEAVDTGGGFTYKSKVGGAGSNLPFGVENWGTSIVQNFTIRDCKLRSTNGGNGITGGGVYGYTLDNVTFDTVGNTTSHGNIRHARIRNCRALIQPSANSTFSWAPSTGCTDWVIENTDVHSRKVGVVHIHEGCAQITVKDNSFRNVYTSASSDSAVSIRARAYDIKILDNSILNAGNATAVYVDDSCSGGGVIQGNRIEGTHADAISVSSENWHVGPNDVPGKNVALFGTGHISPVMRFAGWITYDNTAITLGWIPGAFAITKVLIQVQTAFNSSGTDHIVVGWGTYPSDVSSYSVADITDADSTGIKTVNVGAYSYWQQNNGQTLTARYLAGGGAATAGRALVIVEWSTIPWEV